MKKYLLIIFSLIFVFSGCNKEKAVIFFSSNPIARETFAISKSETVFQERQRIYFVLVNPKPFASNILRLQILKIDRKSPYYGLSVTQARDIEIVSSENHVTDYFCLHQEGYYMLRIFSKDNLNKPIAEADFQVDPL